MLLGVENWTTESGDWGWGVCQWMETVCGNCESNWKQMNEIWMFGWFSLTEHSRWNQSKLRHSLIGDVSHRNFISHLFSIHSSCAWAAHCVCHSLASPFVPFPSTFQHRYRYRNTNRRQQATTINTHTETKTNQTKSNRTFNLGFSFPSRPTHIPQTQPVEWNDIIQLRTDPTIRFIDLEQPHASGLVSWSISFIRVCQLITIDSCVDWIEAYSASVSNFPFPVLALLYSRCVIVYCFAASSRAAFFLASASAVSFKIFSAFSTTSATGPTM